MQPGRITRGAARFYNSHVLTRLRGDRVAAQNGVTCDEFPVRFICDVDLDNAGLDRDVQRFVLCIPWSDSAVHPAMVGAELGVDNGTGIADFRDGLLHRQEARSV